MPFEHEKYKQLIDELIRRNSSAFTIKNYASGIRQYASYCKEKGLNPNEKSSASQFLDEKIEAGLRPTSIRALYFAIRAYFHALGRSFRYSLPKIKYTEQPFWNIDNLNYILMVAGEKNIEMYRLLRVQIATIGRIKEVLFLKPENFVVDEIDGQEYWIVDFRDVAKVRTRRLYIDRKTWELGKKGWKSIDYDYAHTWLRRNKTSKGGFHAIRRGVATIIASRIENSFDVEILRHYLGHRNPMKEVSARYIFITPKQMKFWYEKYHPVLEMNF